MKGPKASHLTLFLTGMLSKTSPGRSSRWSVRTTSTKSWSSSEKTVWSIGKSVKGGPSKRCCGRTNSPRGLTRLRRSQSTGGSLLSAVRSKRLRTPSRRSGTKLSRWLRTPKRMSWRCAPRWTWGRTIISTRRAAIVWSPLNQIGQHSIFPLVSKIMLSPFLSKIPLKATVPVDKKLPKCQSCKLTSSPPSKKRPS